MSQENIELVRGAFAVITIPGDPGPMIAASGPDFEMHLVGMGGGPAHYAGADGIREFFRDVAESWESFRFEATDLRDLGDFVLVLADVSGRGRVSGVEVDDRWGWIVEFDMGALPTCAGSLTSAKHSKPRGFGYRGHGPTLPRSLRRLPQGARAAAADPSAAAR